MLGTSRASSRPSNFATNRDSSSEVDRSTAASR